jgi:2-keto-4-pentenoate hydratase/2-oxohepta-3-ene-1,7-dioic acid hydratase in catechol pathway
MKIARILTEENNITYATPDGQGWVQAEGSLESGWTATNLSVTPKRFYPPIDPKMLFAIGLNYRKHADEMKQPYPEYPVVTVKNLASAIGHLEPVRLPRFLPSDSVDYEVELAVVIGKTCKNIQKEDALNYLAGYMVANDVSARDWQKIHCGGQWVKGKSFDTFCPLGPELVTPDEIHDPNHLALRFELNGEVMQDSNTSDMIFDVQTLITFLSSSTTLFPGTVILTGTPTGVGAAKTPPRFLKKGDHMTTVIEGVGRLENPVEEEVL